MIASWFDRRRRRPGEFSLDLLTVGTLFLCMFLLSFPSTILPSLGKNPKLVLSFSFSELTEPAAEDAGKIGLYGKLIPESFRVVTRPLLPLRWPCLSISTHGGEADCGESSGPDLTRDGWCREVEAVAGNGRSVDSTSSCSGSTARDGLGRPICPRW